MAVNTIWCLLLIGILNQTFGQQFAPGCSFSNGKCIYNVRLGNQENCDGSINTRAIDGSCSCNDVTKVSNDLNNLQSLVDRLEKSMTDFKNQLSNVSTQTNSYQNQLTVDKQKYIQLLNSLHTKNDLLNRTNEEVATVLKTASTEIENLREKLKNSTTELATCQVSLGVAHTSQTDSKTDYTTFYCSFQNSDICKFTQDHDDNTDWRRQSSAASSLTGPKTDHTYGNNYGYYMEIKATDTSRYGPDTTTGRITSPTFKPAPNYCIQFWYTMHGQDVDSLNVYAKVNGGRGYPIYSVKGNIDPYWHLAQIDLGKEYTKSSFQITFEASHQAYKVHRYVSGSYRYEYHNQYGNIAIDDFYLYNTSCNSIPAHPRDSFVRMAGNETSYYTFHKVPATWYDAQDTCRKENVHSSLAVVKSASEQKFLENLINSEVELTVAGQNGFFLNGNDYDSESHFKWTATGYPESVQYSNFHAGQPNNVGNNQDCLLMEYPLDNYEWGDVTCTERHPFICETTVP